MTPSDSRPPRRPGLHPAWLAAGLAPALLLLLSPAREGRADDPPKEPSEPPAVRPLPEVVRARRRVELLEAEVAAKRAELRVQEIRLEQAREDLKAQEASHEAELIRARERLQWSEKMFEKKYISEARLRADRMTLQRLEAASRPAPAKEKPAEPEGSGTTDEARRASDGVHVSQAEPARVRDRMRWAEMMLKNKYVSESNVKADELVLRRAEAAARAARGEEEPGEPEGPRR